MPRRHDDAGDDLEKRVRALERERDRLAERYAATRAAAERWHPSLRERDRLLFVNDAGDIARVPRSLAMLIARDRSFAGDIEDAGDAMRFVIDGEVLAEIPKALVSQLRGILGNEPRGDDAQTEEQTE